MRLFLKTGQVILEISGEDHIDNDRLGYNSEVASVAMPLTSGFAHLGA